MAVTGALTTTFGLVQEAPATFNEAGYDALSFTDCGEVTSLGEFGREYQTVRVMNLADGATRKFKGSYDNGTVQVDILFDSDDAGQTLLEAAGDSATQKYSFKVTLPDGSSGFYFRGYVMSLKRIIGGPDDAIMLRCSIEIDENIIVEFS